MKVHESFDVAAPIDRVFAFLADPRYLVGLDPNLVIAVEQIEDAGPAGGAKYRLSGPKLRGPWLAEHAEIRPPHRMRVAFRQETGSFDGWTSYELEARDGCTHVRMQGRARAGRLVELSVFLMNPLFRWSVRRGNRKLAETIEAWARSSDIHQR